MAGSRIPLTDRLVARAFALAIDPAAVSAESAAALRRLAGADHDALHRALQRVEWRYVDRPGRIAEAAADILRLGLSACTGAEPRPPPRRSTSHDPAGTSMNGPQGLAAEGTSAPTLDGPGPARPLDTVACDIETTNRADGQTTPEPREQPDP
jgi:hypothetical protein